MGSTLLALLQVGSLIGQVLGADGSPSAGARVIAGELGHATLYFSDGSTMFVGTPGVPAEQAQRYRFELTTGAAGEFRAEGLAPGQYSLIAAAPAGALSLARATVVADEAASVRIVLESPRRVAFELTGLGFDATRHVIELRPRMQQANLRITPALVRADGGWSFRSAGLPALTEWDIVATESVLDSGFRATLFSLPVAVSASAPTQVTLSLADGVSASGRTLDASGAPLAYVWVAAISPDDPQRELGAVSDSSGRFALRGLTPGRWRFEARRYELRDSAGCGDGALQWRGELAAGLEGDLQGLELRLARAPQAPGVGDAAPLFSAPTLDGGAVELSSLRGKYVVLDFWATWCGMCRMDLERLEHAWERLAPTGRVQFVGISLDDDAASVRAFVAARGIGWTQTALGAARLNPIARLYNTHSTPSTFLLDPRGVVIAVDLLGEELIERLDELLATPQDHAERR